MALDSGWAAISVPLSVIPKSEEGVETGREGGREGGARKSGGLGGAVSRSRVKIERWR